MNITTKENAIELFKQAIVMANEREENEIDLLYYNYPAIRQALKHLIYKCEKLSFYDFKKYLIGFSVNDYLKKPFYSKERKTHFFYTFTKLNEDCQHLLFNSLKQQIV